MQSTRTLILVLLLSLGWLGGCGRHKPLGRRVPVRIDGRRFELEPAMTPEARYEGLSDRPSIADDGGMIFVFPGTRQRTFVMRDCLVPIDILFLDANARVVTMHRMTVEPYGRAEGDLKRYSSRYPARFAIELKGGSLDQLDISRGQKITMPIERLKQAVR